MEFVAPTEILTQDGAGLLVPENLVVQFDLGVLQLEQGLEEFLADFFLRLNCFLQVVPGLDRDLETREIFVLYD